MPYLKKENPTKHYINRKPFKSDGCTAFPDKFIDKAVICCCFHDFDYWHASNPVDRFYADLNLYYCLQAHGETFWKLPMYLAVRLAGWSIIWPRFWYQNLRNNKKARGNNNDAANRKQ